MYDILTNLHFTIGLILFFFSGEIYPQSETTEQYLFVRTFQFGDRVDGDEISYHNKDAVELFMPFKKIKLTPSSSDFEKNFTYVQVEYISLFSDVTVTYINRSRTVTFYVQDPIAEVPFEITCYSLRRKKKIGVQM